jgi:hypothetical protein
MYGGLPPACRPLWRVGGPVVPPGSAWRPNKLFLLVERPWKGLGILRKFQKMHLFTKIYFNHEIIGDQNVFIESFPLNGHVNDNRFYRFKIWGEISVFLPWQQKTPSVFKELIPSKLL